MSFFDRIFRKLDKAFSAADAVSPTPNSSEDRRGYPPTFGPPPAAGEHEKDLIFDPSTQHFTRAFRRGDPQLPLDDWKRWISARRRVMTHLVELASSGPWVDYLVLRGSLALKVCLGEDAREPGDVDWVIQPCELRMDHPEAKQMMSSIIRDVSANHICGDARIEFQDISRTDIWTYARAPGHRIAFPWRCGELPPAIVQMDFVFEQPLRSPLLHDEVKLEECPGVKVAMAGLEESLAWKLLWLLSDNYPQGKDLYDAVLLAERANLPPVLLKDILEESKVWEGGRALRKFPFAPEAVHLVDWDNFLKECPWVQGSVQDWFDRLLNAIRPSIEELKR